MSDDRWRDDVVTYVRLNLGVHEDEVLTEACVDFIDAKIAEARASGWSGHGTKGTARIISDLWMTEVLRPTRDRVTP